MECVDDGKEAIASIRCIMLRDVRISAFSIWSLNPPPFDGILETTVKSIVIRRKGYRIGGDGWRLCIKSGITVVVRRDVVVDEPIQQRAVFLRKGVEVSGKCVNNLAATGSRRSSGAGEDKRRVNADVRVRGYVGEAVEDS